MTVHTAVPVTHAAPSPAARAALAAAVADLPLAAQEPGLAPHRERWARRIRKASDELHPLCSSPVAASLEALTVARLAENADDDDAMAPDAIAARDTHTQDCVEDLADIPAQRLGDVAAKVALAMEHENGGALLRRERAEAIVRGEEVVDISLYVAASAYLDCLRLATADDNLVEQGREALRLLAIYRRAEAAESAAYEVWLNLLPQAPETLHPRGIDHALSIRMPPIGGVWTAHYTEPLAQLLPSLRERAERHPDGPVVGLAKRAEEILAARAAHDAARDAPEPKVAREAHEALQRQANAASDAAEAVELQVQAAPAHTVAGLAAKARLLQRMFTPVEGEADTDALVRTFLEQVVAADEGAA